MHDTAMRYGGEFFRTYLADSPPVTVADIGSQDVGLGSLRPHCRPIDRYIGVDFAEGPNVDVILEDPYKLPFDDNSIDVVLSSSCFEHAEFFWESFLEIMRVLKPTGLFYLNVPSNSAFHRYPVDCWRFYPDSGRALEHWAQQKGYRPAMLESFTGVQRWDVWNDFIAVFVKDESKASLYTERMQNSIGAFTNGLVYGSDEVRNLSIMPEDFTMSWLKRYGRRSVWFVCKASTWLYWRFQDLPGRTKRRLSKTKSGQAT